MVTGDIIIKVDDLQVKCAEDLAAVESKSRAGDVLKITLVRGVDGRQDLVALEVTSDEIEIGEIRSLRITAAETVSEESLLTKDAAVAQLKTMVPVAGFRISDEGGNGVMVTEVHAGGAALRAGARVGDKIVSINGAQIQDNDAFLAAMSMHTAGNLLDVAVVRDGIVKRD